MKQDRKNSSMPGIKEKFFGILELPKEVILNIPKLTMLGCQELMIENYKGIIEYTNNKIRVNTAIGMLVLEGSNLVIREISSEDIIVDGSIRNLEFIT